ncbi:MAG: hypothetical protein QM737_22800 [Ferruginibacter sp.]
MKQTIAIFIIAILVVTSCNKHSDDNNVVTPSGPVLLKKFILLEDTQSIPEDTIETFNYTYDSQNRCTQIDMEKNGYTGRVTNYYNGTDTLISSRKLVSGSFTGWEYFTYDSNGNMSADSTIGIGAAGNIGVYRYHIISPGLITADIDLINPIFSVKYLFNKDAAGNIIQSTDSSWTVTVPPGYLTSSTVASISYDNHPCPFYKLYPRRLVDIEFENELSGDLPFFIQHNNVLHAERTQSTSGGVQPYNVSYSYQYNSDGYPTSMHYQDMLSGETYNGVYIY